MLQEKVETLQEEKKEEKRVDTLQGGKGGGDEMTGCRRRWRHCRAVLGKIEGLGHRHSLAGGCRHMREDLSYISSRQDFQPLQVGTFNTWWRLKEASGYYCKAHECKD